MDTPKRYRVKKTKRLGVLVDTVEHPHERGYRLERPIGTPGDHRNGAWYWDHEIEPVENA